MSDGENGELDKKSRSQLKREARAVLDLGKELAELPPKSLARIPLSPEIAETVGALREMKSHGARRRQLGFLGKQLRGEDLEAIETALDQVLDRNKAGTLDNRRYELWRDRILRDGDAGIDAFIAEHPLAERQRLRQLYRSASKENGGEKARRALLRYVRSQA